MLQFLQMGRNFPGYGVSVLRLVTFLAKNTCFTFCAGWTIDKASRGFATLTPLVILDGLMFSLSDFILDFLLARAM